MISFILVYSTLNYYRRNKKADTKLKLKEHKELKEQQQNEQERKINCE